MDVGDSIERRLTAVERAVSDGNEDLDAISAAGDHERRLTELEDRLENLEAAIAELDAATQALRGYVGNVRSVNRDVERRANAALAAVDRLEESMSGDRTATTTQHGPEPRGGDERQAEEPAHVSTASGAHESNDRARVEQLATGPEMPVPGSRKATDGSGDQSEEPDDGGVVDRVRDVL